MDNLHNEKLILEEMRRSYDEYEKTPGVLNGKATSLLGWTSLILGLLATLQISLLGPDQPNWYWAGLIIVFILYLSMVVSTIIVLWPRTYKHPIKADWDVINGVLELESSEAVLTMISGYIVQIEHNKKNNAPKALFVRIASASFVLIVFLIVSLSLAPR